MSEESCSNCGAETENEPLCLCDDCNGQGQRVPDWVVIDHVGTLIFQRCRQQYQMNLPCDLDILLAASRVFGQKHLEC